MTFAEPLDLSHLNELELAEIESLLNTGDKPLWEPLPGPQRQALDSPADIIGYGGAAGGGKTDLAIGKALLNHRKALVVRVNGTEHSAFVDRLEEIVGNRDGYTSRDGIWRLRVDGKKVQIELGSVPNLGDERKYRGRPHDLKVFDEAAEIPEAQVRFLLGWMRSTVPGQKCQALLCFNPPLSAEGRWIVKFFAPWIDKKHPSPALPGELRWFASYGGKDVEVADGAPFHHNGEYIMPQSRTFIPAKVSDNPYLAGTGYMSTLQAMQEPMRSQMLYGDFTAGMEDDEWQVIPTAWVEAAQARWKHLDVKPEMDSVGVDVARGGKDKTVIARRHGMWFDEPIVFPGTATPDGPSIAGQVISIIRDSAVIHLDVIGVGASPFDFLIEYNQQAIGVDVRNSPTATDKSGRLKFRNLRSQLYWMMREALDPHANTGIALPPSRELLADLTAPIWKPAGMTVQVESREDIVKRIGRSPDFASAYLLALMDTPKIDYFTRLGVRQAGFSPDGSSGMARDYDPYAGNF